MQVIIYIEDKKRKTVSCVLAVDHDLSSINEGRPGTTNILCRPIGQTSRSTFIPFYVSTEYFPACCGSRISLSFPRKSNIGKKLWSIRFFVEEEVHEKLPELSLCQVKTLETKLWRQIQHCFPRVIVYETDNDALLADFAKRTHHSRVFFTIPAISDSVHGDRWPAAPRFGAEIGLAHGLLARDHPSAQKALRHWILRRHDNSKKLNSNRELKHLHEAW